MEEHDNQAHIQRGQKKMLNETLRGIFTINIIFKTYERVMKIQTETLQETMSNMQAA